MFSSFQGPGRSSNVPLRTIFALLVLMLFSGCTGFLRTDAEKTEARPPDVPLPPTAQLQAIQNEKHGQYLAAIKYWKQAEEIINERLATVSGELEKISETHAQNGITYYEEKNGEKALHEFLEALRYFPVNRVALDYLKNRYQVGVFMFYTVQPGDSFRKIAETVYGSPDYEFMVVNFSDSGGEETLSEGLEISLAVMDSFYSQALLDYRKNIREARTLFKAKDYEKVLPLAETILTDNPGDEEASYIANMSLLRYAEELQAQNRFEEAITMLQQVSPSFKNVKTNMEDIRQQQEEQLERESVLANSNFYQRGKELYSEGRYLEALAFYRQIDSHYQGVDGAIADVQEKLKIQADYHFKEGVKYFVDEDLAGAISEWETTLLLDPDHLNAKNSIEKARRLLKKVQEIN